MTNRELLGWIALAGAVRALVAWRTLVPARDAVTYLWLGERIADGDLAVMFDSVFHPLYPLMIAGVLSVAPGLSVIAAGQLVASGCAALAVAPLVVCTRELFGATAARSAAVLYGFGIWFARHPADCMSEGGFFLVVALTALVIVRQPRTPSAGAVLGALGALGFGFRPEGAAIVILGVPWLAARRAPRAAVAAVLAFAIVAAPWVLGWSLRDGTLTLTPKAAFNWREGAGSAASGLWHYAKHLARVPGAAFEAIGYGALPLAVLGVVRARPIRWRSPTALLLGLFGLQCLVIPGLGRSDIRFLAGFGVALLPFAGHGAAIVLAHVRTWPRAAVVGACVIALAGDLVRLPQTRRAHRVVLVELGEYLRQRLEPGEKLATDMPRLEFFAGRRPGPPRVMPPEVAREVVLAACRDRSTRWVAVVGARSGITREDLRTLGFADAELPPGLAERVADRRVLVLERRE